MLGKIAAITLFTTLTVTSVFAQRNFRQERAELARQEKEEKRKMKGSRLERSKEDYGTNILRLSPITVMDIGVGFGISYEKILGAQQMVGIVVPVHLMLEDNGNGFFSGNGNYVSNTQSYIYFTPGLKIYPFGQRKVTYAVGPSLMVGYGGGKDWRYDPLTGYTTDQVDVTKLRMGILVNNYVNFQIGPSFNLGLELGIGVRYLDRETTDFGYYRNTYDNGLEPTGQFSMTLGYRF